MTKNHSFFSFSYGSLNNSLSYYQWEEQLSQALLKVQKYFNVNNSGINYNKRVFIQAALYFAVSSLSVFMEKTQAIACVKLVETEQDI